MANELEYYDKAEFNLNMAVEPNRYFVNANSYLSAK